MNNKSNIDNIIGQNVYGIVSNIPVQPTSRMKETISLYAEKFHSGAWMTPDESLHITVFDIITPATLLNPRDFLDSPIRDQLKIIQRHIANLNLEELDDLVFDHLEIHDQATILTGNPPEWLNKLRNDKDLLIELPGYTAKESPTTVHCTVARHHEDINLRVSIPPLVIKVQKLRLVEEFIWPMLDFKECEI